MIYLDSLHFRFVNDHSITEKGLKALGHHFKKFQFNLTDLTILFNSSNDNPYGNGIKDFIASVRTSHSTLKRLTLGLEGCYQTNDQDVENFMPEVGKLRLEKLGLILSYCSKLTDEAFESIKAQFPKLLNLQKLTLALRGCKELTENGSQQFLSAINSSLINLKQLNLDFRHGKGWTDNNLVVFANTMQETSSNMQSLILQGLGSRQDYSKGLEALGSRFRNILANLLSLTIESMWAKFTTQSFVEFAKSIALLSWLKKLGLSFEYCPAFNDTCAKNLIVAITENLTNLEELSLIFSSCEQITDQGMEQIGHHLGQNVNKLKHLKLDFSSTKLFTDTGLEAFASKIGTGLHGLKSFALNFSFCDQITGKGLAALCLGLEGHLQDLEKFIFDLMSLPLKDEDFNTWAPFLGKGMTKLKYLSISLIYQNFSDKAIEFLALGISQNLSHLHALIFNIEECTKITDIALDVFCSNIKEKCRNLFKLQLNIERRNEITIKAIDKWTEELKCIPNLIIF